MVIVGDFNSPANGTGVTYNDMLAASFKDAALAGGLGASPTCCQASNLLNPVSQLFQRSDFILFKGDLAVRRATLVGNDPARRTPSGLWPSDHAGLVTVLRISEKHDKEDEQDD